MTTPLALDNATARRLFLQLQGLADEPHRKLGRDGLLELVGRMGFVQLDSIATVERAHHLTLFSRNQTYRRTDLDRLLERDRRLFEHWTHDASLIPIDWFGHWSHRFERFRDRLYANAWFKERIGSDATRVIARVRDHVHANGPTMSRELGDDDKRAGPWWGWGPTKAALEYLWWSGELSVVRRESFQKVYDLTERVIPAEHREHRPDWDEHVDWACTSALDRLGAATHGELAAFWDAVSPLDAKAWVEANRHRLQDVLIESADGSRARAMVAWCDLEDRLAAVAPPPARLRALSPFDPVVRDRSRAQRLFGFDYRFEAFVPASKRRYGYYVLPLLEADRFVGRADLKLHRDKGELHVNGLWWEQGVRPGKGRQAALAAELDRLARFLGAGNVVPAKGVAL